MSQQLLTETFIDIITLRAAGLAVDKIAQVEKYLAQFTQLLETERAAVVAAGQQPLTMVFSEAAPFFKISAEQGPGFAQNLCKFAAEDAEFAKSDLLGKSFSEKVSNFFERWSGKRKPLQTGGSVDDFLPVRNGQQSNTK